MAKINKPPLSPQAHRGAAMGLKLSCLKGKGESIPTASLGLGEGCGGA